MNRTPSIRIWYLLAAIPAIVYFVFVWRYATNAPTRDDIYDILATLLLYTQSTSPTTAMQGLFWPYAQHFLIYDRLVYWLIYALTGTINFRTITLIGNASLLAYFLLLTNGLKREQLYILPSVSLVFFSLYFHEASFWPMAAVSQLTIMAFTLASLQLLDRNAILPACLFCCLAVFTQHNEILIVPLGFLLLLDNVRLRRSIPHRQPLLVWTACSILCLALLYRFGHALTIGHYLSRFFTPLEHPVRDIIISFLASLASFPFNEGHSPLLAAPLGVVQLLLIFFLAQRCWRINRALVLMLLFCTASLLIASVARTPYSPTAYVSRYKIFSTSIVCIEIILASAIFPVRRWLQAVSISAALLFNIYSYYAFSRIIINGHSSLEQAAISWLGSARMEYGGALPLASALLDEAYATGLYNPARDIPHYPALPANIQPIDKCPPMQARTALSLEAATTPGSRAVRVALRQPVNDDRETIPSTVYLCGSEKYKATLQNTFSETGSLWMDLLVLEKQKTTPGNYHLLIEQPESAGQRKVLDSGITIDTHFSPPRDEDCETWKDLLLTLIPVLYDRYCTHSTSPQDAHHRLFSRT